MNWARRRHSLTGSGELSRGFGRWGRRRASADPTDWRGSRSRWVSRPPRPDANWSRAWPRPIPATAEIVLEGTVSIDRTIREGPIGEYTGYVNPGSGGPQPLFHVTAMTYRDQPILPVVASGEPIEENHTCWGLAISAQVLWELRTAGFPVTACFSPFQSAAHWLVVTVPVSYRGQAVVERLVRQLAEILGRSRAAALIPKVILLGDDIDPACLEEVVWAFAARCHPERGQWLWPDQEVLPLLAFLGEPERAARRSTKVIYHGLPLDDLPVEPLPRRSSFRHGVPPEIQAKVLRDWESYGYRGHR